MSWGHSPSLGFGASDLRGTKQAADISFGKRKAAPFGSPPKPALLAAEFLDLLSGTSPSDQNPGPLQSRLLADPSLDLSRAFHQMDVAYQRSIFQRLGERERAELFALSREPQWGFFLSQWVQYARRLKEVDKISEAALALQRIESWAQHPAKSAALQMEAAGVAEAYREWEVLQGKGGLGRQLEFLGPRLIRETFDPWVIAGFGVAGTVFQGTRLAALSSLYANPTAGIFTRGRGAKLFASGVAALLEAPALVATTKLGRGISGIPQDWSAEGWKHEILSAGLTLFFLKSAGAALSKKGEILQQTGVLGGIYLSHRAEETLGWRSSANESERITGALAAFFQLHLGGNLANRAFSGSLGRWQREWNLRGRESSPVDRVPIQLPGLSLRPARQTGAHISLMQGGEGNGKPPGGPPKIPRLVPINGGGEPPAEPSEIPPPLSQKFEKVIERANARREQILIQMQQVELQLAIFLGHLNAGRGKLAAVRALADSLAERLGKIERELSDLPQLKSQLDAWVFHSRDHVENREILERQRSWVKEIETETKMRRTLGKIKVGLESAEIAEIQKWIYLVGGFSRRVAGHAKTQVGTIGFSLDHDLLLHRIGGMLRAPLLKQALRASHHEQYLSLEGGVLELVADAPQIQEYEWMSRLLNDLNEYSFHPDYFLTLLRSVAHPHGILTRESLAHSGSYEEPFRGWLAVYLPVLTAANAGNFSKLVNRLDPVFPLMDETVRAATDLAAWWLCKALRGRGDLLNWPGEFFESPVSDLAKEAFREVWKWVTQDYSLTASKAEELEKRGQLGAAQLALVHFLSHPFDPELPALWALQAPTAIREDTLAFLFALAGAFHGEGFYSVDWYRGVLERQFPPGQRDSELLERWRHLESVKARLDSSVSFLPELWKKERPTEPPRGLLLSISGEAPSEHQDFNRAFDGIRQEVSRSIDFLEALLDRGWQEGFSPGEAQQTKERILGFLEQVSLGMEKLMQVKFSPSELSKEGSPLHWIERVRAARESLLAAGLSLQRLVENNADFRLNGAEIETLSQQIAVLRHHFQIPISERPTLRPPQPFGVPEIRRFYEGTAGAGKSLPPKQVAPLFGVRSDWATAQAIVRAFDQRVLRTVPPSLEAILEFYFEVLGSQPVFPLDRSLAQQTSHSALFSTITPAYLFLHRGNPAEGYRWLKEINGPSTTSYEVWAGVTYLALRFLEGRHADPEVLEEAARFFKEGPMAAHFSFLREKYRGEKKVSDDDLRKWGRSKNVFDRVSLGIHAAMTYPGDPPAARAHAGSFSKVDPEQIAARVAGGLAAVAPSPRPIQEIPLPDTQEIWGQNHENLVLLTPPDEVAAARRKKDSRTITVEEKDWTAELESWFEPESYQGQIRAMWSEWAKRQDEDLKPIDIVTLHKKLAADPHYFLQELAFLVSTNPILAKVLMVQFGLLSESSKLNQDPEVIQEINRKASEAFSEEELMRFSDHVYSNYEWAACNFFREQYRRLEGEERKAWAKKVGELPAVVLEYLVGGGVRGAMTLFLLKRYGLSEVDIPSSGSVPE